MSITTKLLSHSLVGIVSVLPALLVMPAVAGDPYMAGNAFVFGDIAITGNDGTVIDNMAMGGRRMEWNGGKYLNAFPGYNMYGRSLSVAAPTDENLTNLLYVGPVNLTLGSVADKDFRYNFQKDIDEDGVNDDVDIATYGANSSNPIVWNEELNSLVGKVAAVTGDMESAGQSAGGVYMYSRLDTENHDEGSLTLAKTNATIDGAKVTANTISVTDGSSLTIAKKDATALADASRLYTTAAAINSDGATVFNANTINVDSSQIAVKGGTSLTVNSSNKATFSNSSVSTGGGAAIDNLHGTVTFNALAEFTGNSITGGDGQGGALRNKSGTTTFNNGVSFVGNSSTSAGSAIYNGLNYLYAGVVNINGDSLFQGNEGDHAIFNLGHDDVDNTIAFAAGNATFKDNVGGAIWNQDLMTFTDMGDILFSGNTTNSSKVGSAIANVGNLTMGADTITFQDNTSVNGAISNTSAGSILNITANTVDFSSNTGGSIYKENDIFTITAQNAGNGQISFANNTANSAAAINNNGNTSKTTLTADKIVFDTNIANASYGGAIFSSGNFVKILSDDITFSGNRANGTTEVEADKVKFGGGAIQNRGNTATTQIVVGNDTSSNVLFENNYSAAHGGAIHARAESNTNVSTVDVYGNTTFRNNTALWNGGAISNSPKLGSSTVTLSGNTTFTGNKSGGLGGAIYNTGTTTINGAAVFSGNKSSYVDENHYDVNDIYNTGTLNLTAAADKTISLAGGIDGLAGTVAINGAGTVYIANVLKNQTVTQTAGELHLNDADLTGSTVTVNSGATLNSIDNLINDYMSTITLADGAIVKGDLDYVAGLADTYGAVDGATITYKMANALGADVQYGEQKTIQVASAGSTINKDMSFGWYDSNDHGLTLVGGDAGTGTIKVSGTAGGINTAVDDTDAGVQQEIVYQLSADDEFNGADNVIAKADFTITGNGNNADTDNKLVLGKDLVVDGDSILTLQDVVLTQKTGDEAITNNNDMVIRDSRISVNINNAGNLDSDPTFYDARIVNSGTASFTGDIFESTASLVNNSATVNLTNVEFKQGSTVSGDGSGVINILAGDPTTLNAVMTSNALNLASGATLNVGQYGSIDGLALTAAGGNLGLSNGKIDALGDVTANADVGVSLDADVTGAGAIDHVNSLSGAGKLVVNNINMKQSAYKDSGATIALTVADTDNVQLGDGWTTTGGNNYFTKVVANNGQIVFGDKLMNTSGMHAQLGDWAAGNYILASTAYDTTTDSYSTTPGQTVGAALTALDNAIGDMGGFGSQHYATSTSSVATNLSALDTQLNTVSTAGSIADGDTGFITGGTAYTALNEKVNTADLANHSLDINANSLQVNGNNVLTTASTLDGSKLGSGTVALSALSSGVQTSLGKADTALQSSALVGTELTGNTTAENLAVSGTMTVGGNNVLTTASTLDGSKLGSGTVALSALSSDVQTSLGKADTALQAGANISVLNNDAGYQTATDVNNLISAAVTDSNGVIGTAIANATTMATDSTHTSFANFANGTSVTNAVAELDAHMGLVHGLITDDGVNKTFNGGGTSTNIDDGGHYVGNLAVGTTVEDHLVALDNTVGMMSTLSGTNVNGSNSVAQNLQSLDTAAVSNATAITNITNGTTYTDQMAANVTNTVHDEGAKASYVATSTDYAVGTVGKAIQTNDAAIAKLNGDENTTGSVAKSVKDNAENATFTNTSGATSLGTAGTVKTALNLVGTAVDNVNGTLGNMSTEATGAHNDSSLSVASNLRLLSTAIDDAQNNAVVQANTYTDRRIETLDKNLSAGVAGAVALSSVAVSGVERGEVSVGAGYGYFNGQSAAAFGAAMGLSNRWSVNAGAGISNADVSFRAGTNYKFKLF